MYSVSDDQEGILTSHDIDLDWFHWDPDGLPTPTADSGQCVHRANRKFILECEPVSSEKRRRGGRGNVKLPMRFVPDYYYFAFFHAVPFPLS